MNWGYAGHAGSPVRLDSTGATLSPARCHGRAAVACALVQFSFAHAPGPPPSRRSLPPVGSAPPRSVRTVCRGTWWGGRSSSRSWKEALYHWSVQRVGVLLHPPHKWWSPPICVPPKGCSHGRVGLWVIASQTGESARSGEVASFRFTRRAAPHRIVHVVAQHLSATPSGKYNPEGWHRQIGSAERRR